MKRHNPTPYRHRLLLAALTFLCMSGAAPGQAITDPEQAGIEYELQGEYRGRVQVDDVDQVWGAQLIALGDGKFDLVGYAGGLPGDGWSRGDETRRYSGQLVDGAALFRRDEVDLRAADGKLAVERDGTTVVTLEKTVRKSPTLGMAPPAGAIVLFDGSSVDAWENGRLVDDQWLGATGAISKRQFGDHRLHVEFRTPFMPGARGQGRGNSGVYVQGRYEVQVLDSFGLEGKNNECGGIYSIREPNVNMCLPPLAWQTFDIELTAARYDGDEKVANARITVRHNGVLIHDDVELPHGTPGFRAEGPGKESLFLQDHGDPVVFRNIWVVEK